MTNLPPNEHKNESRIPKIECEDYELRRLNNKCVNVGNIIFKCNKMSFIYYTQVFYSIFKMK